jgi:ribosomal protein S27AE
MSDPATNQWSPRCPKCGKLTDRIVSPAPNQVLGGRLSPRALQGLMGQRDRCPRCSTWFPLAEGTEWVQRPKPVTRARPEGSGAEMPDPES